MVQIPNDAAKTNITNTRNDCFATTGNNGSKSHSNGTESISNANSEILEMINRTKKFEISNETAETTRSAAQISRNTIRQRINEQKQRATFAISKMT